MLAIIVIYDLVADEVKRGEFIRNDSDVFRKAEKLDGRMK